MARNTSKQAPENENQLTHQACELAWSCEANNSREIWYFQ
jgi:hypothetical protein